MARLGKRNSVAKYKVQAVEEHVAIMHDRAIELGYGSNRPHPNWMTTNKTPNWDWYFATTPPWLTVSTVNEVFKATLTEQITTNLQLKAAYDGKHVIVTGLGAEVDEHETMHYRLLALNIKHHNFDKNDKASFLNLISMLYRVVGQSSLPYFYHLNYNMDLVSPWAVV